METISELDNQIKSVFNELIKYPPARDSSSATANVHQRSDSGEFSRFYSPEIERPLIATALAYPRFALDILDTLKVDDFNFRICRDVFQAMQSLYRDGRAIDMLTVYEILKSNPSCAYVSLIILTSLCQEATVPTVAESYIDNIKKHSAERKLLELSETLRTWLSSRVMSSDQISQSAIDILHKIESAHSKSDGKTVNYLAVEEDKRITSFFEIYLKSGRPVLNGLLTTYKEIDKKYLGWNPGELHIIAARPGVGKTAFALNLLKRMCIDQTYKSIFFSLEMTSEHIYRRLLSICKRIPFWRLQTGAIAEDQISNIRDIEKIKKADVSIYDFDCIELSDIRREAKRIKDSKGLDIIFIDYLQLMKCSGKRGYENRHVEVSEITRGLKLLAKELSVPIIALSQLSRNVNENERPSLRDLKESGSIEQDADSVMLMYRPVPATPQPATPQLVEKQPDNCINVDLSKNRNGPTGIVQLIQNPECFTFDNIVKDESDIV